MRYRFVLACCLLVWSATACWPAADPSKTTVSLDLKGTPLRQALATLFESTGLQYAVTPDVPDLPITLKVHDMPFEQAIRAMLRLIPVSTYSLGDRATQQGTIYRLQQGVTYRKEGDLYLFELRRDTPPQEPVGQPFFPPTGGPYFSPTGASLAWEKIPVNFLRSNE